MADADVPVRDAATVIIVRDPEAAPRILMGQRGKSAAFMPEKVVFPGGAVDTDEDDLSVDSALDPRCLNRLSQHSETSAERLVAAALREVAEETGLCIGSPGSVPSAYSGWPSFAAKGLVPDASALRFFFRAITPPGRPRRFDARFFLADARRIPGDLDDFSNADAELSHLRWVSLEDVRSLNLAFITRLVLAELQRHLPSLDAPEAVPLVRNDALDRGVDWLR